MLALCASVFPPSVQFKSTFTYFIRTNCSEGYLDYMLHQVARTEANERLRWSPPTALEVHAAFGGHPIAVQVDLHFAQIYVHVDANTTVGELITVSFFCLATSPKPTVESRCVY